MMLFGGPFQSEAKKAYALAVAEGWRGKGPIVYAELVSHGKNPWLFQSSIAAAVGCAVRTVQRWLRRMRDEGLLQCWRGKKKEIPPGAVKPLKCGFSNRAVTLWNAIGERFEQLRAELAAKAAAKRDARRARYRPRTVAEIDAELAKTAKPKPPD